MKDNRRRDEKPGDIFARKLVKIVITIIIFALAKGINALFGPVGVILLAIIWLIG